MTRAQLKAVLADRLGVVLVDMPNPREVAAHSPINNARLFTISLFEDTNGWRFGGCGSLLTPYWRDLCALGET